MFNDHQSKVFQSIENVLIDPIWPSKWPYGKEDFRPLDYTRDDIINTLPQYQYSQSLIETNFITLVPGIFRVPTNRHFILPKDKIALKDHLSQYAATKSMDEPRVLELFSTYESILPYELTNKGPVVGVGWYGYEMEANSVLDDVIEQDISIDPYLPLQDNYFDVVVMPAMFQLLQRPQEMFQEINRVLKPGGTAFIGLKLSYWSFLGWKQGRYYVETNYLEDAYTLGSFFHYAGGFSKPQAYDLTLPEVNIVGKMKDVLFPNPRLDFYAVVQATKRKDSPHGRPGSRPADQSDAANPIENEQYKPKYTIDRNGRQRKLTPYS
jgi:SAM-dependent methyltransferase